MYTPTGDKRYTHYISFLSGSIRCEGDGVVMYGGHVDHHVGELSECSRECGERGSMDIFACRAWQRYGSGVSEVRW